MKKLLKFYDLSSDMQYFELIAGFYRDHCKEVALELFLQMPIKYRADFLRAAIFHWNSGISQVELSNLFTQIHKKKQLGYVAI